LNCCDERVSFPLCFSERPNYKDNRGDHGWKIYCKGIGAVGSDSIGNSKGDKERNHKNTDGAVNDLKHFPSRNSTLNKKQHKDTDEYNIITNYNRASQN